MAKGQFVFICQSVTIRTMLEDLGVEASNEEDEVKEVLPFPNIDSEVLKKVIDWCEQHKNDPEPEKEKESKDGERKQKQIVKLEGWGEEFMGTINYINQQDKASYSTSLLLLI